MVSANITAQLAERACSEPKEVKLVDPTETNEEISLTRLVVTGLTHFRTSVKRQRSESEDEGGHRPADEALTGEVDWGYEDPDRQSACCNSAQVASMLQFASLMDTRPTPTQEPRHRYKRRNSIVDAMLHPSTRQFIADCQDEFVSEEPTRYKRSSLPWNFKSPTATS